MEVRERITEGIYWITEYKPLNSNLLRKLASINKAKTNGYQNTNKTKQIH
jgi:hypothetical protein